MFMDTRSEAIYSKLRKHLDDPLNLSDLRRGTTSAILLKSFGKFFKKDQKRLNAACLSWLWDHHKTSGICIFHEAKDTPANRAFLDWLVDLEESPWKSLLVKQPKQDKELIFNTGYALTELAFPANLVVNFLTAFRWSFEKSHQTNEWFDLVNNGVCKHTAFVIANSMPLHLVDWHSSMNASAMSYLSVKRFGEGKPNVGNFLTHNFCDDTYYSPCNTIWKQDNSNDFYPDLCKIIAFKEYRLKFGLETDEKCQSL